MSAKFKSRAKFKHQNVAFTSPDNSPALISSGCSSQPSLWQGRSFCFPRTPGQLGIITPAKPSLSQHNEAELSIPRCAGGKCPACLFLTLPFQMWSGREPEAARCQPGSGLGSGQWSFPLETLCISLLAVGGSGLGCPASYSAGLQQLEWAPSVLQRGSAPPAKGDDAFHPRCVFLLKQPAVPIFSSSSSPRSPSSPEQHQ